MKIISLIGFFFFWSFFVRISHIQQSSQNLVLQSLSFIRTCSVPEENSKEPNLARLRSQTSLFRCKLQSKEAMNNSLQKYLHLRVLSQLHTCSLCAVPAPVPTNISVLSSWPVARKLLTESFQTDEVCRTRARLNTRPQDFQKGVTRAKQVGPGLLFRSNNADFEIGKFRLKVERDSCQGMPCASKQTHNIWEIDVTWETFMSLEHMCVYKSVRSADGWNELMEREKMCLL